MPVMKVGPGRALLGGGGTYNDLVMGTGPITYWPQSESSGLTAYCLTNPAMNGTYTGVTLANDLTGPFGTPAPFYDGATSYCNIYSAALAAAFDGAEGSLMIWAKVNAVGVWTDAANRFAVILRADGNNRVFMQKVNVNNRFRWTRIGGGVVEQRENIAIADIAWMCMMLTWSEAADQVRAFYNGAQEGATMTILGAFAGALVNNLTNIGSETNAPANPWHGWLGPCGVWTRALPPAEVASLYVG